MYQYLVCISILKNGRLISIYAYHKLSKWHQKVWKISNWNLKSWKYISLSKLYTLFSSLSPYFCDIHENNMTVQFVNWNKVVNWNKLRNRLPIKEAILQVQWFIPMGDLHRDHALPLCMWYRQRTQVQAWLDQKSKYVCDRLTAIYISSNWNICVKVTENIGHLCTFI